MESPQGGRCGVLVKGVRDPVKADVNSRLKMGKTTVRFGLGR
jgi:hypothetical protein